MSLIFRSCNFPVYSISWSAIFSHSFITHTLPLLNESNKIGANTKSSEKHLGKKSKPYQRNSPLTMLCLGISWLEYHISDDILTNLTCVFNVFKTTANRRFKRLWMYRAKHKPKICNKLNTKNKWWQIRYISMKKKYIKNCNAIVMVGRYCKVIMKSCRLWIR